MTAARNKPYRHHIAVITAIMVITSGYVVSSDVNVVDVIADVVFTTVLDAAYAMHGVLSLTATASISNNNTLELKGVWAITTFKSGTGTYAAVTAYTDDGVQILNITDPSNITAAGRITDTPGSTGLELDGARGIATFKSGTGTYAAVAAVEDDGVQILNITDPSNITAAGRITDTTGSTGLELNGAYGITTFKSGTDTYAAVAANLDAGVQILNITDPLNIIPAGSITGDGTNTDSLELNGARGITTFKSGTDTYAAVTGYTDDGIQILNITDPYNITAAYSIKDGGALALDAISPIITFNSTGGTYIATAELNTIQILNITDLSNITLAGSIASADDLEIRGVRGITTFESGDHVYIAAAANSDDGVQILDVTDPSNIIPAGNIADDGTNTDSLELNGALDIATFNSNGNTYVAVAAYSDDGVQIIRIDIAERDDMSTDITPPVIILEGSNLVTITVGAMYNDEGATCDDVVDGSITPTSSGTVDTSQTGSYTVTYSCTDAAGNNATVSRIVKVEAVPGPTAEAFITTWKTTTTDKSITLPLEGSGMTVNWGDGNTTAASGSVSHTYGTAGDYTIQITGDLTRFHLNDAADASKLVSLDQWGTASWASMKNAFSGASNMVYNATDSPDLSSVTDMSGMLAGASSFNGDLSSWGVSSVTDMNGMFFLATSFNGDISSWDVSSVTDMSDMFSSSSSFNGNLSSWDVSSVDDMLNMFTGATSFNGNISGWDVSSVTDMSLMFNSAFDFNQPLSSWDVSSVTDMSNMFNFASDFNQPLSSWDVSSVENMSNMFRDASSFNGNISGWDVSSVTSMSTMFAFATSFDQNLGNWYVVPADTTYDTTEGTLNVTTISAQNTRLDGHSLSYGIDSGDSGDSNLFNITDSNTLMFKSTPFAGTYNVNVTASGTDVFSNGNNWRLLEIRVTGQTSDTTPPPTFVSSELNGMTRVLTITFSETIDATNIDPTKIHIRESGTYSGGITLTAIELSTTTDANTISFILTRTHLDTVAGLATPELTIEPGAVQDTSGNLIVSTFDVSTASYDDDEKFSVSDQESSPLGMAFSNDGAKMFVVGNTENNVNEYDLSTPFDVSTATFVHLFNVTGQGTISISMAFSNNGAKMFVLDFTGYIDEYTLSTPFDVSTASYDGINERFDVSGQDSTPQDVAFSNDGTKMLVLGAAGIDINEYTLSTPFDVSTASYAGDTERFSVLSEEVLPSGMAFSNDGAKMFVVGFNAKYINKYTLSTPFDVSTAIFAGNDERLRISGQDSSPQGMVFSNDGTKMFVVGNDGDDINEYTLSSVYPITVTRTSASSDLCLLRP